MNFEHFQDMDAMEQTHFWFRARREIIESVLCSHELLDKSFNVLEIGCGTGGNLLYFQKYFTNIKGCEINPDAIIFAKSKLERITIKEAALPYCIPFEDEKFDLILFFDVLEHIEDDVTSLLEVRKKLSDNGHLVITVPAYQFLYGAYDIFLCHFRRYNYTKLLERLTYSGFDVRYASYFNCWLFPLVLISRVWEKFVNKTAKYAVDYKSNSFLNELFYKIMKSEKFILKRKFSLPFGSSIIAVAKNIKR